MLGRAWRRVSSARRERILQRWRRIMRRLPPTASSLKRARRSTESVFLFPSSPVFGCRYEWLGTVNILLVPINFVAISSFSHRIRYFLGLDNFSKLTRRTPLHSRRKKTLVGLHIQYIQQ